MRATDSCPRKQPFVVSNLRLAVNQGSQTADPGDDQPFQGYQGHYCSLPSRVDPSIVACSFIMSGLRVFDIRDLAHPREIAYFNKPLLPGHDPVYPVKAGAFAMAAPAYDQTSFPSVLHEAEALVALSGFFRSRSTSLLISCAAQKSSISCVSAMPPMADPVR